MTHPPSGDGGDDDGPPSGDGGYGGATFALSPFAPAKVASVVTHPPSGDGGDDGPPSGDGGYGGATFAGAKGDKAFAKFQNPWQGN